MRYIKPVISINIDNIPPAAVYKVSFFLNFKAKGNENMSNLDII